MKNSLYQSLLSRLKNKHNKLATRFHKSVKEGEFQRQQFRKRRDAVERLKSLEKRISILGQEVGVKPRISFKHWAVAIALGVVVSASAQQKPKESFKTRLSNYSKQVTANNQLLAQSVFFEPKVALGSAYLSTFHSGDLDGDGDIDAIYVSYLDSPIILTNQGSFTFTKTNLTPEPLQVVDQTILADFDGDGDLDLFMVNGEYGAFIAQMWVNDGSGNFTSQAASFPLTDSDDDNIHLADVDGDGDLDIITEDNEYPSTVTILTNDAFTFSIDSQLSGPNTGSPGARPVAVLDVDDDGDIDIVYTASDAGYSSALHVFENADGLGSFVDTGYSVVLSYSFETLPDTLDIDNDGDTDLIGGMSNYPSPVIMPFINDGTVLADGTSNFTEGSQINLLPGQYIEDVFTSNFNNDGNDDFMVNTEDGDADSVFLYQENAGAFDLLTKLTGQSRPADLDGDGDDDLFHFDGNVATQENQGSGTFVQGADIITVTASFDVRLVDIDGDGDLDLAEGGGHVSRSWLNDGNGNFSISQEFPGEVYQLAFGDLDGDGDQDMVVALEGGGGEYPGMIIYTNAGGTLSYHSNLALGYEVDQVELADMDQDSDLDIVARLDGISNNYIRIFDNTGSLTFSETSSYLNEYGKRMALGDIDGDTDHDIVLANEVYGIQTLINNNGLLEAGTLASPAGGTYYIADVDLSDLDGDGDLDIFASNAYESPTTNSYVFLNNGSGTFTDNGQNVETGSTYNSYLGDVDSDGDDDLVSGGYISYPQLWINDGAGNFTFDHDIPTIVTEYGKVLFGDLDADGNQDMVIGDYYGGINFFFNSGVSNALEADSLVLNDIYDTMGGVDWVTADNWGTGALDTWHGVTLNTNGDRVSRLELPDNGLTGTLPASINQLDALEVLDLSGNDIDELATDFSGLTSATSINLDGNQLDFGDLEAVAGISVLTYDNQDDINAIVEEGPLEIPQGSDQTLTTSVNGTANTYQWVFEGSNIAGATADNYTITDIGRDKMGTYSVNISNSIATETTISSTPIDVFATAVITANVIDSNDDLIPDDVDGYILEIKAGKVQFDTLDFATQLAVSSEIVFPPVILGDFLISVSSDPEKYVPTYYSDAFLWDEADTLFLTEDATIDISITEVPPERDETTGDGVVSGTIEEDFGDEGSRIDARRRAAKRKCGLRRKTGGGRIGQDDDQFELIAYGETNENGEFEYGFLPQGTYRFFVEYPGIPLDESAFVQFDIGPAGVGDNDFKLAVFASEDGITIEVILGASSPYFNNFEIYPNPTFDRINIHYDQARKEQLSVQVLDLNGKVLMNQVINQRDKQLSVDLSGLGAGQYLIRIFDENDRNAILYKVIKK